MKIVVAGTGYVGSLVAQDNKVKTKTKLRRTDARRGKITKIYCYENQFLLKIELVHYLKIYKQVTSQAKYGIL